MKVAMRGMERDVRVIEEWRDIEVSGETMTEGSQSRGRG
jgi:hypothetical protein